LGLQFETMENIQLSAKSQSEKLKSKENRSSKSCFTTQGTSLVKWAWSKQSKLTSIWWVRCELQFTKTAVSLSNMYYNKTHQSPLWLYFLFLEFCSKVMNMGDSHHKQKEDIMYLNVDGFSGHWFVWDMTCFPSLPTSAGSCSIPLVAKSNTSFQSLTFFVRSLS
jgi:hypothetical protein